MSQPDAAAWLFPRPNVGPWEGDLEPAGERHLVPLSRRENPLPSWPGSVRPEIVGFEGQRIDVREKDRGAPDERDATDRQDRAIRLGSAVV
jgi:hypothetical protein